MNTLKENNLTLKRNEGRFVETERDLMLPLDTYD